MYTLPGTQSTAPTITLLTHCMTPNTTALYPMIDNVVVCTNKRTYKCILTTQSKLVKWLQMRVSLRACACAHTHICV